MRPWFCQMFHCVCSVDGRASPRGSSKRRPCSCSPKRVAEHCVVRGGGGGGGGAHRGCGRAVPILLACAIVCLSSINLFYRFQSMCTRRTASLVLDSKHETRSHLPTPYTSPCGAPRSDACPGDLPSQVANLDFHLLCQREAWRASVLPQVRKLRVVRWWRFTPRAPLSKPLTRTHCSLAPRHRQGLCTGSCIVTD